MKCPSAVLICMALCIAVMFPFCSKTKEKRQSAGARGALSQSEYEHVVPPAEGREAADIYGDSGTEQRFDILSGKQLDHEVFADHEGFRIYFHCPVCRDMFQLKAKVYMNAIRKRHIILEDLSEPLAERIKKRIFGDSGLPQSVDVISGKQVNPMVFEEYNGKRVYFCCYVSKGFFEQDKELYLDAIKKRGIILEDASKEKK